MAAMVTSMTIERYSTFESYSCVANIATTSILTEMVKGKTPFTIRVLPREEHTYVAIIGRSEVRDDI